MRVTIISDDMSVGVDGVFFDKLSMPQLPADVHAVQWDGLVCEVEYKKTIEGGVVVKKPNAVFSDFSAFAFAFEVWDAAKAAADAQEAANTMQIPVTKV